MSELTTERQEQLQAALWSLRGKPRTLIAWFTVLSSNEQTYIKQYVDTWVAETAQQMTLYLTQAAETSNAAMAEFAAALAAYKDRI